MSATLAERLGFQAGDRVVVVHVDDLGMCHAANDGGLEALASGPATCGSVMVPCPWFGELAARARANPGLDLGVHLTLNSEFEGYRWGPCAPRAAVPSLLDDEGCLYRTTFEVAQHAKPEEVEIELRAQIDRALAAGIDVTHVDSHMGTLFFPRFAEVYVRLASDYRLPAFGARASREHLEAIHLGAAEPMLREVADRLEAEGLPVFDSFCSDSLRFAEGGGEAHNHRRLDRLPTGVSYLICHAARGGDELSAITEQAHAREFERGFYGGEPGRRAIESRGFRTVGMRAIRDLARAA